MQQELKLRIVSGVILAVLVLLATWYGGVAFSLLSALIGLLIYYEWSTITRLATEQPVANAIGWLGQAAIAVAVVAGTLGYSLILLALFFLIAVGFVFVSGVSRWFPTGIVYAGLTELPSRASAVPIASGFSRCSSYSQWCGRPTFLPISSGAPSVVRSWRRRYPRKDMVRRHRRRRLRCDRRQPGCLFCLSAKRRPRSVGRLHSVGLQPEWRSFRILHQAPLRRQGFEPSDPWARRRHGSRRWAHFRLLCGVLASWAFSLIKGGEITSLGAALFGV